MNRRATAALAAAVVATTAVACARAPRAPDHDAPDLALRRPAAAVGVRGEPAVVTDGKLAAEGAAPDEQAVLFDGVRSAVVVDLGAPVQVGALLVQAGAADVYFVESSTDGAAWRVCWRVPSIPGAGGLRTRTRTLPEPVAARWIRLRPTTTKWAAASEVQAFAAPPEHWPPPKLTLPYSRLPVWPWLTRERAAVLYPALGTLLLLALAWNALASRRPEDARRRRRRRGALVAAAVASLLAWPNFLNFHYFGFVHTWEFFHYYLGAKYLPELGYTRLYACAAAVDAEDGIDLRGRPMRDLRTNRVVPSETELERAPECRSRFSDARWEDFRRDARFFRDAIGADGWAFARNDHGFNGTPAWALLGRLLAGSAPASWTQVVAIASIDLVLVVATLVLMGRAFGLESAALAAGFWGVNALSPWGWTGGGFLRYDWLFWLVLGLFALRRRRPGLAGFALGWATLLRIFPLCAIAGVGVKAVAEMVEKRSFRPAWRHARFAAGVLVAVLSGTIVSGIAVGRAGIWTEFAQNSAKHLATPSANLIGLRVFVARSQGEPLELLNDPLDLDPAEPWKAQVTSAEGRARPAVWAAGAAFLLIAGIAAMRQEDWVAAVLGLGLMPVVLVLSSYYYSALIAYSALWPLMPGAGLALAALAWLSNVTSALLPAADEQYAWLSLAVVIYVTGVTGALAWRGARPPKSRRGDAMTNLRIEKDTFGPIEVPADRLWGAQTQRSLQQLQDLGRAHAAARSSTRWPWSRRPPRWSTST